MSLFFEAWLLVFFSAITPGPNNIILASSGLNFGLRKTLPYLFGVIIGVNIICLSLVSGLSKIIVTHSSIDLILSIFGGFYMLYLAYKIFMSKNRQSVKIAKPFTFLQSFLLQWINPKTILATIAFTGPYIKDDFMDNFLFFFPIFFTNSVIASSLWTILGNYFNQLFKQDIYLKLFNYFMALILLSFSLITFGRILHHL